MKLPGSILHHEISHLCGASVAVFDLAPSRYHDALCSISADAREGEFACVIPRLDPEKSSIHRNITALSAMAPVILAPEKEFHARVGDARKIGVFLSKRDKELARKWTAPARQRRRLLCISKRVFHALPLERLCAAIRDPAFQHFDDLVEMHLLAPMDIVRQATAHVDREFDAMRRRADPKKELLHYA